MPPVSLRSNFAWTFAGNAVYAACQWAVLSLVAKLGGGEMLGQYALAAAVTAPVAMLSHLNLRAVLATDVEGHRPFGDYLAVRLSTTGAGLAAIAAIAFVSGRSSPMAAASLLVGLAQGAEQVSDIYHGALQRRERMDRVGRSMMARGIVSLAALAAALAATRELLPAVAALALGRLAVLLAYDRPLGSAGESLVRTSRRAQWAIFRTALPLGIVLMLAALNTNLPRYAIERHLGTRELGAFAAVASFMTVGSTVINALGQAATPRLARCFSGCDLAGFRRLALQLAGVAASLGAAGVAVAAVAGKPILALVYRPEYAALGGLLTLAMGAGAVVYLAGALGYVVTSARAFDAQMPLFCAVAAASGLASFALVPRFGLPGAVMALALAACLQIAGQAWILARALRRREPAR